MYGDFADFFFNFIQYLDLAISLGAQSQVD